MRHGHSPSIASAGVPSDALRPLSDRGREDVRCVCAELLRREDAPDLILHSPLTRAAQSAAAASATLTPRQGVHVFAPLDNTRSAEDVFSALSKRADNVEAILAIGHQPQIGEIAALLVRAAFDIGPATIIALDLKTTPRVLWILHPNNVP